MNILERIERYILDVDRGDTFLIICLWILGILAVTNIIAFIFEVVK